MGVGQPSSKPCRLCGEHRGNIVEPVRLYTTCVGCRKYPTRHEKVMKLISSIDVESFGDNAKVTDYVIEVLDAKTVDEVDAIILRALRGE